MQPPLSVDHRPLRYGRRRRRSPHPFCTYVRSCHPLRRDRITDLDNVQFESSDTRVQPVIHSTALILHILSCAVREFSPVRRRQPLQLSDVRGATNGRIVRAIDSSPPVAGRRGLVLPFCYPSIHSCVRIILSFHRIYATAVPLLFMGPPTLAFYRSIDQTRRRARLASALTR